MYRRNRRVGQKAQVSEVTELAMQGELDFTQSLHQRVACLAGVEYALMQTIRDRLPLMPGLPITGMFTTAWMDHCYRVWWIYIFC